MDAKPGDLVYYIGEWCPDDDLPTAADVENYPAYVVVRRGERLFAVPLDDPDSRDEPNTSDEPHPTAYSPAWFFPTPRAALLAFATAEEEYGRSCLALAARLRELADTLATTVKVT
jgi:hypothetical protein